MLQVETAVFEDRGGRSHHLVAARCCALLFALAQGEAQQINVVS